MQLIDDLKVVANAARPLSHRRKHARGACRPHPPELDSLSLRPSQHGTFLLEQMVEAGYADYVFEYKGSASRLPDQDANVRDILSEGTGWFMVTRNAMDLMARGIHPFKQLVWS